MKIYVILDLDGVLITTPPWKADELDPDGYSKFNAQCIENLNRVLTKFHVDIWLSSSRRLTKTLDEFNVIFKNRGIQGTIKGLLPECAQLCLEKRRNYALFKRNKPYTLFNHGR